MGRKGLPLTRTRSRSPSSATFTPCSSDEEEPPKTHQTDNPRASTSSPSDKPHSKDFTPRRLQIENQRLEKNPEDASSSSSIRNAEAGGSPFSADRRLQPHRHGYGDSEKISDDNRNNEDSPADYAEAQEAQEINIDDESEPLVREGPVRRDLSWSDFNDSMKDLNFTKPNEFLHKTDPKLDNIMRKDFIEQVFLRQDQRNNTAELTDKFFQAFKRTDESMECENLVRWIIENGIVRCCQADWTILFEKCFALMLLYVDKQCWTKAKKTG